MYMLTHLSILWLIYWYVACKAYHCNLPHPGSVVGNMAMLPLRTKYRGPAPLMAGEGLDVVDEALQYFKANVFFRTYEVKVRITLPLSF